MTPYEKLEELYANLPTVECQRKCHTFCGPILIPKIEAQRLEERRGYLEMETGFAGAKRTSLPAPEVIEREFVGLKPVQGTLSCVFLDPVLGGCIAYRLRPLVCRLWGCLDEPLMRCPYGCQPTRWVTPEEHKALYEKIIAIQKGEGAQILPCERW